MISIYCNKNNILFFILDTYEEACSKCDKAIYASDLNTDVDDENGNNRVQVLPKQQEMQVANPTQLYKSSFEGMLI